MTATKAKTPQPGDPCPNGCLASEIWQRDKVPEVLKATEDGEVSCPTCWDYFGNIFASPETAPSGAEENQ